MRMSRTAGSTNAADWTTSPRRVLNRDVRSRIAATTPKKRATTMKSWMNFSPADMGLPGSSSGGGRNGGAGVGGPTRAGSRCVHRDPAVVGWSPRRFSRGARPSGGRPGLLDVGEGVLGALAGDPGGHLLPEGPGAHGAGHLVGTVEAEHRLGVLQRLRGELVDRAGQVLHV